MIRIDCPFCGLRDHAEFTYERPADIAYPPLDAPTEAWNQAVYERENRRGPVPELWRHGYGCGMWLRVTRDTLTHQVHQVEPTHPGMAAALEVKQ